MLLMIPAARLRSLSVPPVGDITETTPDSKVRSVISDSRVSRVDRGSKVSRVSRVNGYMRDARKYGSHTTTSNTTPQCCDSHTHFRDIIT
jgi:hypothetical protein